MSLTEFRIWYDVTESVLQAHLRCKHTQKSLPHKKAESAHGFVNSATGWIV